MSGEGLPVELTRVPRRGLDGLLEWTARHPTAVDLAGAAAGTGFLLLIVVREHAGSAAVNAAAVAATAAALAVARRFPFPVLAVVLAAQVTMSFLGTAGPMSVPVCLALYPVVAHRPVLPAAAAVLLAGVAATADAVGSGSTVVAVNIMLSGWVLVLLTALAALLVRGRRARLRRADAALLAAARSLRLDRERQALTERVAVARDLHDSVGHALTSVIALGQGARKVLELDPEQARQALDLLVATASAGLTQTRDVVDRLQDRDVPDPAAEDLDALPQLAETVTAAGVTVTVQEDGERPGGPASALLFRVAREGLTNVLRHAPGAATAHLHLSHAADGSTLELVDDGHPDPAAPVAERGLAGLRQQVTDAGGSLTAGPAPGGGWRLHAHLPRREDQP